MIKKLIYVLFGVLIFSACKRTDLTEINKDPKIEITIAEVKEWYNKAQAEKGIVFNKEISTKIGVPNWSTAVWQKDDPKTPALLTVNLDIDFGGYGLRKLIFTKLDGEINGIILQSVGELSYLQKYKGIIDPKNFTGDNHFLNLSGRFIEGYRFKDGKITFQLKDREILTNSISSNNCETTYEGGVGTLCTVVVTNTPNGSGWTYLSTGMLFYYLGNSYINNGSGGYCLLCTTIYPYGGGGGCTNCSPPPPPPPPVIVLEVIKELPSPCPSASYDKLTAPRLKNVLVNMYTETFVGTGSTHSLYIHEVSGLPATKPAESGPLSTNSNIWEIRLNADQTNLYTQEYWGSLILHEIVHGFIRKNNLAFNAINTFDNNHKAMLTSWINLSERALIESYGLSPYNARALALGGLDNVFTMNTPAINQEIINWTQTTYSVNLITAITVREKFRNKTLGTACN